MLFNGIVKNFMFIHLKNHLAVGKIRYGRDVRMTEVLLEVLAVAHTHTNVTHFKCLLINKDRMEIYE